VKGVISMARAPSIPDSGGSQFFILLDDDPRLDGIFTPFGRVVEGMEVLDRIAARPVLDDPDGEGSRPVEPPVIREIRPIVR
jgi:peptidyl-prolyl cis-trans isomerase B (cyclophilin B)